MADYHAKFSYPTANAVVLTPAEAKLWACLSKGQLDGRKFRRQFKIGHYRADFCCVAERLIIEVDGGVHNHITRMKSDDKRTEWLVAEGFKVIRFTNKQVLNFTNEVLESIQAEFGWQERG